MPIGRPEEPLRITRRPTLLDAIRALSSGQEIPSVIDEGPLAINERVHTSALVGGRREFRERNPLPPPRRALPILDPAPDVEEAASMSAAFASSRRGRSTLVIEPAGVSRKTGLAIA